MLATAGRIAPVVGRRIVVVAIHRLAHTGASGITDIIDRADGAVAAFHTGVDFVLATSPLALLRSALVAVVAIELIPAIALEAMTGFANRAVVAVVAQNADLADRPLAAFAADQITIDRAGILVVLAGRLAHAIARSTTVVSGTRIAVVAGAVFHLHHTSDFEIATLRSAGVVVRRAGLELTQTIAKAIALPANVANTSVTLRTQHLLRVNAGAIDASIDGARLVVETLDVSLADEHLLQNGVAGVTVPVDLTVLAVRISQRDAAVAGNRSRSNIVATPRRQRQHHQEHQITQLILQGIFLRPIGHRPEPLDHHGHMVLCELTLYSTLTMSFPTEHKVYKYPMF